MTQDELILEINTMVSKKDLRILKSVIDDRLKMVGHMVKYSLDRGDIVMVEGGRKIGKEEGTIVKVNKTRCQVRLDSDGNLWNIPISMIKPKTDTI